MNGTSGTPLNTLLVDAETLRLQELAEKKKRRLERNRASARQCRKRKKEKKLLLRQQLAQLEAENLQLRLKLQVGNDAEHDHDIQSAIITTKLNEMITEGASEIDIDKKIQELKERFSDYGRDRRSAVDFHITQLRRCLQPTQTTRAILWLMSLAPKFYEITTGSLQSIMSSQANDLMALWYSLLETIKPTPEQRKLMISYTTPTNPDEDPFESIKQVTDFCNQTLDRIVEIICNKNDNLDQEMANLQNILSPRQTAKFILWIDKNPACMQMLEALWPHVTQSIGSSGGVGGGGSITPSSNGLGLGGHYSNGLSNSMSFNGLSASTSMQNFSVGDDDGEDSDDMSSDGEDN